MRQNSHYFLTVESAIVFRNNARQREHIASCLFFPDSERQFCICSVTRFDRDEVPSNATANQREIANNIVDFVPNEFVGEAQRFLAENGIAAQDDGVFQAAALDQVLLHERFDLLVVNKCPGRGYLALENRRRDFNR